MKNLIVTADDFGLTKSINAGIIRAYEEGIVTDFSILPFGSAFEEAAGWLKSNRISDTGVHLSLTGLSPLSPPDEISSLVAGGGQLLKRYRFLTSLVSGRISSDDIYRELKRQLERVRSTEIGIAHINSHEHIHMMPEVLRVFIKLAREYDVPAIRSLCAGRIIGGLSPVKLYRQLISFYLGERARIVLEDFRILFPNRLYGFLNAGCLTENIFLDILNSMEDGLTEIVCHPGFLSPELSKVSGWHINCEDELYVLTSRRVKGLLEDNGIKLTTYREYARKRPS